MSDSIAASEKPLPHLSFFEWTSKLHDLQQSTRRKTEHAYHLRHSAAQLRLESKQKLEWETYRNDHRLADRVQELMKWRNNYQNLLGQVEQELSALRTEKAATDKEVEALNIFIQITSDCLSGRDARKATELTEDLANIELKKELRVEDDSKASLSKYCQLAWETINVLEKLKFDLLVNIKSKSEALAIDYNQMVKSKDSADISFKPDALKIVKGSVSYQQWIAKENIFLSECEKALRNALAAREGLFLARGKTSNTMRAQVNATEYALRRRIYETKRAHSELSWQKNKMLENMGKLIVEMENLQASILAKTNGLKLAETRLENRCYRPTPELALDLADEGIKKEVKFIRNVLKGLNEKFDLSKAAYNDLEARCIKIGVDLEDKTETMEIDENSLKIRDAAKEKLDQNQFDRSVDLVKIKNVGD